MSDTTTNDGFKTKTVGQIVAEDWRAAAIFDRFGIDFCCGGRRTVAEASQSAGVDVAAVEAEVTTLPREASDDAASHWTVDRLVGHIVATHHAYVRGALTRIGAHLTKLVRVHGGRHPELADIASRFETVGRELVQHMLKEEEVLFPYIRDLATGAGVAPAPFGSVANAIRAMEREHEEAGALMHAIRTLACDYTAPADGCATYRVCFLELAEFERDLHRHVHLENNVLFPKAMALETVRH